MNCHSHFINDMFEIQLSLNLTMNKNYKVEYYITMNIHDSLSSNFMLKYL